MKVKAKAKATSVRGFVVDSDVIRYTNQQAENASRTSELLDSTFTTLHFSESASPTLGSTLTKSS